MKKIVITISVLMTMSFAPQQENNKIDLRNKTNYELYEAISDVEDYIEWLDEDLFQGRITEEKYEVMLENYEQTLVHLKNVERDLIHLTQE